MPIRYAIDRKQRVVITTASGEVRLDEILEHARQLRKDPDFEPTFSQLVDCREIGSVDVSENGIRKMIVLRNFAPGARRALVAGNDEIFGLARSFELMREDAPDDFQIFRDVAAARRWLGLA